MKASDSELLRLAEPEDYFRGVGQAALPVPTNILLFLRATRDALQQEALQNRSHHRFVLAMNIETSGSVHVDHLTLPFAPGQALLIHPYQFHHFSHLVSKDLKWLFCTFELVRTTFLEPLRNRVVGVRKGSLEARSVLLREWQRCRDNQERGEMQEAQLQAALLYLLTSLREDLQREAPDLPPEPQDSLLRTVNRMMAEWRGRPVVVADVADELGLSPSRLRAVFREMAGIPLGGYIKNYQINRAMALLRTSELSIAEIAEEAGFASPQAFSRVFKSKTGLTPRDYRSQ
jgi:AraC-like DNA-binding protein